MRIEPIFRLVAVSVVSLTLLAAISASAQTSPGAKIEVVRPWARATAATAKTGAAYMTLRNPGDAADRLIGASSPAAGRAELHTHIKDGEVMRMRKVDTIALNARGATTFAPGGLHVMLFDLKAPLKEGATFPLTLKFERAGEITTEVHVRSVSAAGPGSAAGGHGSH
jgi:copper(I)-binding protein